MFGRGRNDEEAAGTNRRETSQNKRRAASELDADMGHTTVRSDQLRHEARLERARLIEERNGL